MKARMMLRKAVMFQNDRRAEASGPGSGAAVAASPFGVKSLQVQERTSETLKSIETYQRGMLEALRELAERMPELQVI